MSKKHNFEFNYRISSYSFRGNYSRVETICGNTVCQKKNMMLNFIQKLKSKHTSLKKYIH